MGISGHCARITDQQARVSLYLSANVANLCWLHTNVPSCLHPPPAVLQCALQTVCSPPLQHSAGGAKCIAVFGEEATNINWRD